MSYFLLFSKIEVFHKNVIRVPYFQKLIIRQWIEAAEQFCKRSQVT